LGTLATIGKVAEVHKVKPPVIILVGEVVTLRDKLNWFETLPLFGRKIVVTRSREQASDLSERLRKLGALPIEFPTIEILPPDSHDDLDHCAARLGEYDWIIFTSANGVRFFISRLLEIGRDIRDLKGPRIAAIGPKTAEELEALKIRVDFVPREYRAEAIYEGMRKEDLGGKKILIPRAKVARDVLPAELRKAGARVEVVEVYRTIRPESGVEKVRELLEKNQVAAVTFTSSSTVTNFVELLGKENASKLMERTIAAAIGPVTAETAKSFGIETAVVPKDYTIPALVESLVAYFKGKGK
jgi:uroporphyrinogen III methyltransferase/synthase